jgi:hypothetical protein
MALRTIITIWDTDGDEADRIRDDYVAADYDQSFSQRYTLSASSSRFEVELGPVTTAKFVYLNSGANEMLVYLDNSMESRTFTGPFLVSGCSVTAMHVLASNGGTLTVYVAGD